MDSLDHHRRLPVVALEVEPAPPLIDDGGDGTTNAAVDGVCANVAGRGASPDVSRKPHSDSICPQRDCASLLSRRAFAIACLQDRSTNQ